MGWCWVGSNVPSDGREKGGSALHGGPASSSPDGIQVRSVPVAAVPSALSSTVVLPSLHGRSPQGLLGEKEQRLMDDTDIHREYHVCTTLYNYDTTTTMQIETQELVSSCSDFGTSVHGLFHEQGLLV